MRRKLALLWLERGLESVRERLVDSRRRRGRDDIRLGLLRALRPKLVQGALEETGETRLHLLRELAQTQQLTFSIRSILGKPLQRGPVLDRSRARLAHDQLCLAPRSRTRVHRKAHRRDERLADKLLLLLLTRRAGLELGDALTQPGAFLLELGLLHPELGEERIGGGSVVAAPGARKRTGEARDVRRNRAGRAVVVARRLGGHAPMVTVCLGSGNHSKPNVNP
jgi:hypothetical protein